MNLDKMKELKINELKADVERRLLCISTNHWNSENIVEFIENNYTDDDIMNLLVSNPYIDFNINVLNKVWRLLSIESISILTSNISAAFNKDLFRAMINEQHSYDVYTDNEHLKINWNNIFRYTNSDWNLQTIIYLDTDEVLNVELLKQNPYFIMTDEIKKYLDKNN